MIDNFLGEFNSACVTINEEIDVNDQWEDRKESFVTLEEKILAALRDAEDSLSFEPENELPTEGSKKETTPDMAAWKDVFKEGIDDGKLKLWEHWMRTIRHRHHQHDPAAASHALASQRMAAPSREFELETAFEEKAIAMSLQHHDGFQPQ